MLLAFTFFREYPSSDPTITPVTSYSLSRALIMNAATRFQLLFWVMSSFVPWVEKCMLHIT